MPAKLKPSTKEYIRDIKGKMTKNFRWNHFTPSGTSTKELKEMFTNTAYRKKKNLIKRELLKRNEII